MARIIGLLVIFGTIALKNSIGNGVDDKAVTTNCPQNPLVNTGFGVVLGSSTELTDGSCIWTFFGIPFAKPPTGPLRFQKPEPPNPWSTVKDVSHIDDRKCLQNIHPDVHESEDCLYLDVYSPQRDNSTRFLPVMVWIHGGGFVKGTKNTFNGTVLASQGVVVVTVNYRLGVLGFLSTEESTIPGNFGLMDQLEALKWVKNNIETFGGNPNNVTIFGESAGVLLYISCLLCLVDYFTELSYKVGVVSRKEQFTILLLLSL